MIETHSGEYFVEWKDVNNKWRVKGIQYIIIYIVL